MVLSCELNALSPQFQAQSAACGVFGDSALNETPSIAPSFKLNAPVFTGTWPWVTEVTAICLTVLQMFALWLHLKRGDNVAFNLVLLALSAFVV
jgi:hypothetical protein